MKILRTLAPLRTFSSFRTSLTLGLLLLSSALSATVRLENYVNDFANVLSPHTREILTEKLERLEREDSSQIVVVTLESLQGQDINALSHKIAQSNGIGTKAHNNGAMLLLAVKDRQVRIEVGKGLEGRLTDWMAGSIIDNSLRPHYARGDFNTGTIEGINAMTQVVKGEYQAPSFTLNPVRVIATLFLAGFMAMGTVDCHAHNFHRALPEDRKKTKGRLGYAPLSRGLALLSLAASLCMLTEGIASPSQLSGVTLMTTTLGLTFLAIVFQRAIEAFFESCHTDCNPKTVYAQPCYGQASPVHHHRHHPAPKAPAPATKTFSGRGGSFGGGGARGGF